MMGGHWHMAVDSTSTPVGVEPFQLTQPHRVNDPARPLPPPACLPMPVSLHSPPGPPLTPGTYSEELQGEVLEVLVVDVFICDASQERV